MSSRKRTRETESESSSSSKRYRAAETKTPSDAREHKKEEKTPANFHKRRRYAVQGWNDAGKSIDRIIWKSDTDYLCAIFNPIEENKTLTIKSICFEAPTGTQSKLFYTTGPYIVVKSKWAIELAETDAYIISHPNHHEIIGLPYCWFAPSDDVLFYTLPVAERKNAIFTVLEPISSAFGLANVGKVIWDYAGATVIQFLLKTAQPVIWNSKRQITSCMYGEDSKDCMSLECTRGFYYAESSHLVYHCVGYDDLF